MSDTVTLTIDGETIEVEAGTTVLEAALGAGICIPNLCYIPDARPTGACRLCIVEVEQHGRRKMTASCTLDASNGMIIHAHSDDVLRARRNIIEILRAEAPDSEVLEAMAERLGVTETRYSLRESDCILCGRCVTACSDIAKSRVKGSIGRGIKRHIGLPFYKDTYCQKCYECNERCPLAIPVKSKKGPCGVCGSELSKNERIPEVCEDCILQ